MGAFMLKEIISKYFMKMKKKRLKNQQIHIKDRNEMLSAFFFGMGNVLWSELDGKHKLYFYYFFYKIPAFEDFNQFQSHAFIKMFLNYAKNRLTKKIQIFSRTMRSCAIVLFVPMLLCICMRSVHFTFSMEQIMALNNAN